MEISEHESRDYEIDEAGRASDAPTRQDVSRNEAHFRYDYDAHGNWLKKEVESRWSIDGDFTPASVEIRDIEYSQGRLAG